MDFFNVLSVEETNLIIEDLASIYVIETESIHLNESVHRIVSQNIYTNCNLPEFNRSTVDGYAVRSDDIIGASESIPSFLECVYNVEIGKTVDIILKSGQAIYVPTGGMVPEGADGVVMIEYSEKLDDKMILIHKPVAPGENISFIGDDIKEGELAIEKGKKLSPYDIGLLAGIGVSTVQVYKKPKIAILSTGDEIIDIDEEKKMGKIRDINGYAIKALISSIGGEVVKHEIVKDDFDKLKSTIDTMVKKSDIVLISGGSSVGTRDYTKRIIESFEGGKIFVHGVSVKPGKPTIIGQIDGKAIFGLPGHPASALMIFNIFVKSYFEKILNKKQEALSINATITKNVHSAPGKETYQMVELVKKENEWLAIPIYAKSGMVTLLSKSSGYVRITDEKEGIVKGDVVKVNLLQEVYL